MCSSKLIRYLRVFAAFVFMVPFMACDEIWVERDYVVDYVETDIVYEEEVIVEEVSDPDDASGGLDYWSSFLKGSYRSFYGSFILNEFESSCVDSGYYDAGLVLPRYLDLYDYEDMIDFEGSYSRLAWNAVVGIYGSFGFDTNFLDWYGDPSVFLSCDCEFYNQGYEDEGFECACQPSNISGECLIVYDVY